MSRLHAFLASMQEMQSLQAAEVEALTRPVGPAGRWPSADGVMAAGAAQRGEPSNGIPVGSTPAWIDPSLPPVTAQSTPLDSVRDMRERQQQQASEALLRAARLRTLYDRLHAEELGVVADKIHSSRHTTFVIGNAYMRQSLRQTPTAAAGPEAAALAAAVPKPSSLGYGKQFDQTTAGGGGTGQAAAGAATADGSSAGSALDPPSPDAIGARAILARCAEEFGRCEDSAVDVARYLLAWQSYTAWASGMYENGRGFEVPHFGRVVVTNQRFGAASGSSSSSSRKQQEQAASFFGSHRMLGQHGLTQRLAPDSGASSSSAFHRAARVNYTALSRACGLGVDDIISRLKEFMWCLMQIAGEQPEADMQIDLGPCMLFCKQRRISVQFHRPPGNDGRIAASAPPSPPSSPPLTPGGEHHSRDRSPSVVSAASDASSWTVRSVGSIAAQGRWARWPLAPAELRAGETLGKAGSDVSSGSWLDSAASWLDDESDSRDGAAVAEPQPDAAADTATAEVVQLSAANAALGSENAMLRAKLDRLLHFTTNELQTVVAAAAAAEVDANASIAMPMPPTSPRRQPLVRRPTTARCSNVAVPVAPPLRHCGGSKLVGSSYPCW